MASVPVLANWLTEFGPQHIIFAILLVALIVFLVIYRRRQM